VFKGMMNNRLFCIIMFITFSLQVAPPTEQAFELRAVLHGLLPLHLGFM